MIRSLCVCVVLATTACGTMFSGTQQDVRITSSPRDAQISFYELGGQRVLGPASTKDGALRIQRPKYALPYLSVASSKGYCPAYQLTTVNPTGGFIAEILLTAIPIAGQLAGLAGILVDNSTGGCCAIAPIELALEPEEKCL